MEAIVEQINHRLNSIDSQLNNMDSRFTNVEIGFFFLYGTFLSELVGQRILNAEHVGLIAFAPLLKYYSSCIVKLESKRYGQWKLSRQDCG